MKVRIIKASKPTYWYANLIGKVFEVEDVPFKRTKIDYSFVLVKDKRCFLLVNDVEIIGVKEVVIFS